ncbi:MAG: hypothetical protein ACKOEZ_06170, partial [Spartobacteria bacterium]
DFSNHRWTLIHTDGERRYAAEIWDDTEVVPPSRVTACPTALIETPLQGRAAVRQRDSLRLL